MKVLRTTLAIWAQLFVAHLLFAQSVPPLMNYQGHLTGATGQPLATGQYTLTFNVYNVPTEGDAVWGPQAIVADVIDGYFNVVLNADTSARSITTAFTAQPRYVSIRVDAASEILPRQQVLSAPYAIQAGQADATVGTANIFPSSGNVGIGTLAPDRALRVLGSGQFDGSLAVTSMLSANALQVESASVSNSIAAGGSLVLGGSLQFSQQKFCRVEASGHWASHTIVPSSWTKANCNSFMAVAGSNNYAVGCIFSDGSSSIGTLGGGSPSPNCGW